MCFWAKTAYKNTAICQKNCSFHYSHWNYNSKIDLIIIWNNARWSYFSYCRNNGSLCQPKTIELTHLQLFTLKSTNVETTVPKPFRPRPWYCNAKANISSQGSMHCTTMSCIMVNTKNATKNIMCWPIA